MPNRNWVIRPGLEIHLNGRGKFGITIGGSARSSGAPCRSSGTPVSALRVGITISGSTRSSDAPHHSSRTPAGAPPLRPSLKRPRASQASLSAGPISEDFIMPGVEYPPQGGIRPRDTVFTPIYDMSLLTNLIAHPLTWVRRFKVCTHLCMFLYLMSSIVFVVLTLFSRVLCRTPTPRCSVEVGGQISISSWMVPVGSTATS